MIPKIVPGRRDGKSSFKQLAKYVTEGIEQSGEPPDKYSWANLTQYITKESVLNALGENVEKTIGVEIGNVTSLANAPAEMYAVAQRADGRVKESVYHYILSWPEHERPKTEDIFAAARDTLAALGMSEHQYIIAIHANTDNLHAHIEVNRVHPKTFVTADTYRDYVKLHRAARRLRSNTAGTTTMASFRSWKSTAGSTLFATTTTLIPTLCLRDLAPAVAKSGPVKNH